MNEFFSGIEQVELKVNGGTARFPIFYRDARMFTIMLPARLSKLRRMLPDPRYSPARIVPGVGAVALTAFEYYDTDIRPYNEFSIGIMLNSPHFAPLPGYNILRQHLSGMYSVYIHHLPVTTEIALRGGIDFYNYPKFLADIEFNDTDSRISCELSARGERILTVSGPRPATRAIGEMKFFCNLYQYRQPQSAEFKLNVIDGFMGWLPSETAWSFNAGSAIGRELHETVIGPRAVMYLYMPKIQCVLYGPDRLSIPLLRRVLLSEGFMPEARPRKAAGKPAARKKAAKRSKPAGKKAEPPGERAGEEEPTG